MNGDAREPGCKRRAALELSQVLVGANVGILHDVFGFGVVTEDRPHHAVKTLVIAANQNFVERRLSGQDSFDNVFVRPAFDLRFIQDFEGFHREASIPVHQNRVANRQKDTRKSFRGHAKRAVSKTPQPTLLFGGGHEAN